MVSLGQNELNFKEAKNLVMSNMVKWGRTGGTGARGLGVGGAFDEKWAGVGGQMGEGRGQKNLNFGRGTR